MASLFVSPQLRFFLPFRFFFKELALFTSFFWASVGHLGPPSRIIVFSFDFFGLPSFSGWQKSHLSRKPQENQKKRKKTIIFVWRGQNRPPQTERAKIYMGSIEKVPHPARSFFHFFTFFDFFALLTFSGVQKDPSKRQKAKKAKKMKKVNKKP